MLWIKTGSKKLNKRQRVLTSIVIFSLVLVLTLSLTLVSEGSSSNALSKTQSSAGSSVIKNLIDAHFTSSLGGPSLNRSSVTVKAKKATYKDRSGKVRKVDTTLTKVGSKLVVSKAAYKLELTKNDDKFTFKADPYYRPKSTQIKVDEIGARTVSRETVQGNKALYINVYPNTDLERVATPTGVKQSYILKRKGHPNEFRETITTPMKLRRQKDGSISLLDKGKEKAFIPRPYLIDATGKKVQLNYQLSNSTLDSRLLTLRLGSLKGLVYPIKVDPSIIQNQTNFNGGGFTATSVDTTVNPVKLTYSGSYATSGTLESPIPNSPYNTVPFDAGAGNINKIDSLSWETAGAGQTSQPANTELKFQVAVNNDNATWNYVGPDGTAGTYFTTATGHSATTSITGRYIRYKAYFSTTDTSVTPSLTSVTLNYTSLVSGDTPGGDLVIDGTTYTITGDKQGANGYKSVTVKNGATLNIQPNDTVDGAVIEVGNTTTGGTGQVLVTGSSSIIPKGYYTISTSPDYDGRGVTINATDIQVDSGSKIDANGQGYAGSSGPGAGANGVSTQGGGGAGYGANGGSGFNGPAGGNAYGSSAQAQPIDLGSGGGNGYHGGSSRVGAGAIKLILSGILNNNGILSSNGLSAIYPGRTGGGSGGSIFIDTEVLSGSGQITAKGGNGYLAGGGAGGRVAIYYGDKSGWSGTSLTATGVATGGSGHNNNNGGTGTLYMQSSSPQVLGFSNQAKLDGATPLKTGEATNETGINLNFWYKEEGTASLMFTPEIEYKPVGTAFDGTTFIVTGSQVSVSGNLARATVTIPSGSLTDGVSYHWRARIKNVNGSYGLWSSYGENPAGDGTTDGSPANTDFKVNSTSPGGGSTYPPLDIFMAGNVTNSQTGLNIYQDHITFSGGHTVTFGDNTSLNVASPNALTLQGTNDSLTLGANSSITTDDIAMSVGNTNTVTLGTGSTLNVANGLTLDSGKTITGSGSITLTNTPITMNGGTFNATSNTTANTIPTLTMNSGTLNIGGAQTIITLVSPYAGGNLTLGNGSSISNTTGLTIDAGTITFTGDANLSGLASLVMNAGTFNATSNTTTNTISTLTMNGGTFNSGVSTVNNLSSTYLSGDATFGAGSYITALSGLTMTSGTLNIGDGSSLASSSVTLNTGSTLNVGVNTVLTNPMPSTTSLTFNGGTLTGGAYTKLDSPTAFSSGTINLGNNSSTTSNMGSLTIPSGSSIVMGDSPTYQPTTAITGGSLNLGSTSNTNPVNIDLNSVTLNSGSLNLPSNATISRTTDFTVGKTGTATFTIGGNSALNISNNKLTVSNNSSIIPKGYYTISTSPDYDGRGVTINATDIQVDSGSKIDANGQGYAGSSGPGAGANGVSTQGGGGAGYGANGGSGFNGPAGGNAYGSSAQAQPIDLGSGGGNGYHGGSSRVGAGAIKLILSGILNNNGILSSNGLSAIYPGRTGGGSGGSIFIDTEVLSGSGQITAKGGNGYLAGGGAGGRVAIYYGDKSGWSGTSLTATGVATGGSGHNNNNGGTGSLYIPAAKPYNFSHTSTTNSITWNWSESDATDATGGFQVFNGVHLDDGSSTAVGAGSLTDSGKSWTTDEFANKVLIDGAGATFNITSNTATVLTLASGTPASGPYVIESAGSIASVAGGPSGNFSWTQTGLGMNTSHSIHVHAISGGAWSKNSTLYTAATPIEAPGTVSFGTVDTTSITVSASNTSYSNITSGSSGLIYELYDGLDVKVADSGANPIQNTNPYTFTGLTANKLYKVKIKSQNGDVSNINATALTDKYTLPKSPVINEANAKDNFTWYPAATSFTFANANGWGEGNLAYYKYVWKAGLTSYAFDGSETELSWSSTENEPRLEIPSASGEYYLHVKAFNAGDIPNSSIQTLGPFKADTLNPNNIAGLGATSGGSNYVGISWNAATDDVNGSGINKIYIERRNDGLQPGEAGYNVFTPLSVSPLGANITNITDDDGGAGLSGGVAYTYRLKTEDNAGQTSNWVQVQGNTEDNTPPSTPASLSAIPASDGSTMTLTWNKSIDGVAIDKYEIYRSEQASSALPGAAGSTYTLVKLITSPNTNPLITIETTSDTGLVDNKNYYYVVRSYDSSANPSLFSNEAAAKTPDVTTPSTPTNASASAVSSEEIKLSWDPSTDISSDSATPGSGIDHYSIYRAGPTENIAGFSPTNDSFYTTQLSSSAIVDPDGKVTFNNSGLDEFKTYYYKITAVDKAKDADGTTPNPHESARSSYFSTTTLKASKPTSPINLSVVAKDGDYENDTDVGHMITLSFNGANSKYSEIDKYEVYRSTTLLNDAQWLALSSIKTISAKTPKNIDPTRNPNHIDNTSTYTFNDRGLNDKTNYYYKIKAIDNTPKVPDNGPFSTLSTTYATTKTVDVTYPAAPSKVNAVDIDSSDFGGSFPRIVVSWPKIAEPADFKEYRLYRSFDGVNFSILTATTLNYYIDSDISSNTYYYMITSADTFAHDLGGGQTKNNETPKGESGKTSGIKPSALNDRTNPVLSSVKADAGANEAKISFTIDEAATSIIELGTNLSGKKIVSGIKGVVAGNRAHSVKLNSLKPNTTYYYSIKSTDTSPKRNGPTVSSGTFKTKPFKSSSVKVRTSVSSAIVTWDTNVNGDSFVEFGKKITSEDSTGKRVKTRDHKIVLKTLKPGTKYKFRVASKDAFDNVALSSVKTFKTKPFKISGVKTKAATNSTTITWSTNVASSSGVEYRGEDSKESLLVGDARITKRHKVEIKNLKSGTKFSFKLKSRDKDDNVAESKGILSFRTKSLSEGYTVDPKVSKLDELELTATSAKINWTTEGETSSWVEYGSSKSLGKTAGNDTLTVDHIVTLEGLTPGTTYYYRVKGEDVDGNKYQSSILSFTALVNPEISSKPKVKTSNDSATISWSTNTDTDSIIEYGLTSRYGDSMGSGVLTKTHEIEIKSLAQDTTYNFRVGGVDKFSNKVIGEDATFKTNKDTTGPVISKVRNEILRSSDEEGKEKISIIVNFTTNEEATSYIEYAEGISMASYNKKTRTSSLNLSHSALIEDLKPSTTYHYRVVTKDKYGNKTKSKDKTILTPKESETVLQKIIKVLEDTFGWVSNLRDYMQGNYKG